MLAVKIVLVAPHNNVPPEILGNNVVAFVTINVSELIQKPVCPDAVYIVEEVGATFTVEVVAPVFQVYVEAPFAVKLIVVVAVEQIRFVPFILTVGLGATETVTIALFVKVPGQPV